MNKIVTVSILAVLAVAPVGCDQTGGGGTNSPAPTVTGKPADNTANNAPARAAGQKTPLDQGNSAEDTKISAEIRKSLMDDKDMSMNAKNCKVITDKGVVTLEGVVASQAEKDAIGAKAKAVAGVVSVDNRLEIKAG
jgi:hyperosmotically inducible periplasmic protein